jgi:hypothetical protein
LRPGAPSATTQGVKVPAGASNGGQAKTADWMRHCVTPWANTQAGATQHLKNLGAAVGPHGTPLPPTRLLMHAPAASPAAGTHQHVQAGANRPSFDGSNKKMVLAQGGGRRPMPFGTGQPQLPRPPHHTAWSLAGPLPRKKGTCLSHSSHWHMPPTCTSGPPTRRWLAGAQHLCHSQNRRRTANRPHPFLNGKGKGQCPGPGPVPMVLRGSPPRAAGPPPVMHTCISATHPAHLSAHDPAPTQHGSAIITAPSQHEPQPRAPNTIPRQHSGAAADQDMPLSLLQLLVAARHAGRRQPDHAMVHSTLTVASRFSGM